MYEWVVVDTCIITRKECFARVKGTWCVCVHAMYQRKDMGIGRVIHINSSLLFRDFPGVNVLCGEEVDGWMDGWCLEFFVMGGFLARCFACMGRSLGNVCIAGEIV